MNSFDKIFQIHDISNDALAAIAQGPTVIYICEAFGNFAATFITANIKKQLGYSEEDFLSIPNFWADHIHPDDKERVFTELDTLFDSDHHIHEYRFLHKDGHYLWMHDEVNLVRDDAGAPKEIVGHWVDVSANHNLKEELKHLTAELNATLDSTTDGILVVGNDGEIKRFNKRFIELWNIPENVIAAHDDKQAIRFVLNQLSDPDSFRDKVEQLYTTPEADSFDLLEFKDGKIFERYSRPLQVAENKITGRVWSFRDITKRKQTERELTHARDEAEHANEVKSQFLASMSHELRTPLNAIIGFSELMQMNSDINFQKQEKFVVNILTAAEQLLGLINGVLDLSTIGVGKLELKVEPLCVSNIVANCVLQVSSAMASDKSIKIKNSITDPTLFVVGNNLRFRQVLINLLSNAVKYNKDYGQVTINSLIANEGMLRIEVNDTGAGIPQQQLQRLFSPFERLEQKNGTISGVGIGLHISKQLIEEMHGTIGVESIRGKGSTFWFDLPLADEVDKPVIKPNKVAETFQTNNSKFVVLYIEDKPINLELVKDALETLTGVELLMATTAEEGLTLAEKNIPDLILMDIQLPGIDGIAATNILKSIEITRDIPIVALSANAMEKDIQKALDVGCSQYLTKPLDIKALYKIIDGMREQLLQATE